MKHPNLPLISIIIPTLNQGRFIEQTICSILDQGYPYLEVYVIDGVSTDETLGILHRYKDRIHILSEKDRGQSDAINKGIRKSKGEIIGYINSDDYLLPGALLRIGRYFSENPDVRWVTGKCKVVNEHGLEVRSVVTRYKNVFLKYLRYFSVVCVVQFISQPSTFWRRDVVTHIGTFDESLHYDMDYDYWLRIWKTYPLGYIDEYLSDYRVHTSSKAVTSPETQFRVEHEILQRHVSSPILLFLHKMHVQIALFLYRLLWV